MFHWFSQEIPAPLVNIRSPSSGYTPNPDQLYADPLRSKFKPTDLSDASQIPQTSANLKDDLFIKPSGALRVQMPSPNASRSLENTSRLDVVLEGIADILSQKVEPLHVTRLVEQLRACAKGPPGNTKQFVANLLDTLDYPLTPRDRSNLRDVSTLRIQEFQAAEVEIQPSAIVVSSRPRNLPPMPAASSRNRRAPSVSDLNRSSTPPISNISSRGSGSFTRAPSTVRFVEEPNPIGVQILSHHRTFGVAGSNSRGAFTYYRSESMSDLDSPPNFTEQSLGRGDIYLHDNTVQGTTQAWVFCEGNKWVTITDAWNTGGSLHCVHPDFPDRVLTVRSDDTPNWIRATSFRRPKLKRASVVPS
ncbi:hypothetical protein K438DRAFT_1768972 [Mycena galopus ATCC 62051]|nr:hypothetical protein K438DRAFT_1768972 [Mycena galopus ATCC 62051]